MEELRAIFLRQIKNIPFIECVDKNKFYDEFLNSPKESLDIVLILSEININQTVDEFDIFKSLDEFNTEDKIKFKAKVLEIIKPKNEKYFIPNIQKTKTFKYLNEVWEVYYNFLKTITGNHNHNILGGKPLDAADFVTEPKDIDFDRYKEVEITVNRILQLLEYFDNNTQNQIFEKLFDESIVKTILLGENKIYKSVEPIITHFKEDLETKFSRLQLEKSNPKATQKQTIDKSSLLEKKENIEDIGWFKVGLKFADGTIKYKTFGRPSFKEITSNAELPDTLRSYVSSTYNNNKGDKNIFRSKKHMTEIYNYCVNKKIEVSEWFLDEYKKFDE